jgi:hypothetical protein
VCIYERESKREREREREKRFGESIVQNGYAKLEI